MTTVLAPPVDDATRRQVLGGAGILLLTAGCGQDGPPQAARDSAGGFPVTVEHALGTTTLPRAPERVVALGGTDADVAVVLGVTPVGVSAYDFSADGFPPC